MHHARGRQRLANDSTQNSEKLRVSRAAQDAFRWRAVLFLHQLLMNLQSGSSSIIVGMLLGVVHAQNADIYLKFRQTMRPGSAVLCAHEQPNSRWDSLSCHSS